MQDQTLEELLEGWKEETVSTRQAIDQLLRHVCLLHEQVRALERRQSPSPAAATLAAPSRRGSKRR